MKRFSFILFLSFFFLSHIQHAVSLSSHAFPSSKITSTPLKYKSFSNRKENKENQDPQIFSSIDSINSSKHKKSSPLNRSTKIPPSKKQKTTRIPLSRTPTPLIPDNDTPTDDNYTPSNSPPGTPTHSYHLDSLSFLISPAISPATSFGSSSFEQEHLRPTTSLRDVDQPHELTSHTLKPEFPVEDETPGSFLQGHKTRLKRLGVSDNLITIGEILNITLRINETNTENLLDHPSLQKFVTVFIGAGGDRKNLRTLIRAYKTKRSRPIISKENYGDHVIDPEVFRCQKLSRDILGKLKKDETIQSVFQSPNDESHKKFHPLLTEEERRELRRAMEALLEEENQKNAPTVGEPLLEMETRLLSPFIKFITNEKKKIEEDPENYKKLDIETVNLMFYRCFKSAIDQKLYHVLYHDEGYVWLIPHNLSMDWKNKKGQTNKDLLPEGGSPVASNGVTMEAHHVTMTDITTSPNFYKLLRQKMKKNKQTFTQLKLTEEEQFRYGCVVLLLTREAHDIPNLHPNPSHQKPLMSQVHSPHDGGDFDNIRKEMNKKVHNFFIPPTFDVTDGETTEEDSEDI